MSMDHAFQTALRLRLVGSSDVTALVAANSILDRNSKPAPDPSIIIGEGQSLEYQDFARKGQMVHLDIHVWQKEPGLVGVKDIAWAVRSAINSARLDVPGFHCADCRVSGVRYLRDPDGLTAHAVISIEAVVTE